MVKCNICGKEYKSIQPLSKHISSYHNFGKQAYYDKYMKQPNEGICLICNKPTHFYGMDRGYNIYCSKSCQVIAQNNFGKVDHFDQWKTKHQIIDDFEKSNNCTHISKLNNLYGCDWQKLNIPIIRISKMYQYVDNRYIEEIIKYRNNKKIIKRSNKGKIKPNNNCKIKHEPHWNNPDKNKQTVQLKNKQFEKDHNCTQIKTLVSKYGQGWLSLKLPIIMRNHNARFISNIYLPIIQEYASKNHRTRNSKKECELYNIINQNCKYKVLQADRKTLPHFELDIYIPALNLAFEYNGIKWHSIENGMRRDYHLNKSLLCRNKNIRLIHIYESENFKEQIKLAVDLVKNGIDNYPKNDFNKNNLINDIPEPEIVYQSKHITVYGAGALIGGKL